MAAEYAQPEVLVSTDWVDQHRRDPHVRIVESDEDLLLYQQGHIAEAVRTDWVTDLQDQLVRDYIDKARFEELCAAKGISNDTTVVFYGDKNNWWACYAFWTFKLYGHEKCLIMNGGRKRWELDNRELVNTPEPKYPRGHYVAKDPDPAIRAFRDEVLKHQKQGRPLVDVRSPGEYTGETLHMPDYPQEGAAAGRSHSQGDQHSLVARGQRRWDLQISQGAGKNLRQRGASFAARANYRLLPHRRALEPHLVCTDLSVGLSQREEL